MFLGFLMIGMAGGLIAGGAALGLGQTIGMAIVAYMLTGLASTVLGAILSLIPMPRRPEHMFADAGQMAIEG